MKVDLLNLRNPLAPSEGLGHIWRPDSLVNFAARLRAVGIASVQIHDENIAPAAVRNDAIVGMTLVGPSWIPVAKKRVESLRFNFGQEMKVLIGGALASSLTREEIEHLFGEGVFNGMDESVLEEEFGITGLPTRELVDVLPVLKEMPESLLGQYSRNESSLYLADGCHFRCSFCAASKGVSESYRGFEQLELELKFHRDLAKRKGVEQSRFYLTNLDALQSPSKFMAFLDMLERLNYEDLRWRGLSTFISFERALKIYPNLLSRMSRVGFERFDFGADGSPETWARVKKRFNTEDRVSSVLGELAGSDVDAGVFMVVGHQGMDDAESVNAAADYLSNLVDGFGVVPRPYVSTAYVPGSETWESGGAQKDLFLKRPELLHALEYAGRPSFLKGNDPKNIDVINDAYDRMLALPKCPTRVVAAIHPEMSSAQVELAVKSSWGQYDL